MLLLYKKPDSPSYTKIDEIFPQNHLISRLASILFHSHRHHPLQTRPLLKDLGDQTSGDGSSTLTHVEALSRLQNVGLVELADHLDVVTGHNLLVGGVLGALGPCEVGALVSSSDEHLGPVVLAESSVATSLVLGKDIHGNEELLVCLDGAGNGDDHTTTDILTLHTTEEKTRVVTCAGFGAGLLEGLNVGDLGLDGRNTLADKLDFGILLEDTTLDTARADGSTSGNGEDILDGHEEGLLGVTLGRGDPGVDSLKELINLGLTDLRLAVLESAKGGTHDDGGVVTLEAVGGEKLTHFHLDELQHLLVLNGIDLVDENDNLLHTDLAGEEQVLSGLGPVEPRQQIVTCNPDRRLCSHLTIGSGDDDDGTVHVCGTRNHVLDVIGVTRAVDVGVMPVVGGVLDVCGGDGDTTLALLRGLVDGAILEELGVALLCLTLGDGGCEGGLSRMLDDDEGRGQEGGVSCLSVIDVTDGSCWAPVSILS